MKTTMILFVFGLMCIFVIWFTTPVHKTPENQQQVLQNPPQPSGTVSFDKAGVSLVPGAEWQQLASGSFTEAQSICLPVLKGEGQNSGNLIQVFTTAVNSDAKTAADILKKEVDADSNTLKGSFKQEDFNSIYRVQGIQASYDYEVKGLLRHNKLRVHIYLFQNKNHNCIAIHYITFVDKDSARVDQVIHDTLRLN